jgi:hypothetical protein
LNQYLSALLLNFSEIGQAWMGVMVAESLLFARTLFIMATFGKPDDVHWYGRVFRLGI